MEKKEMSEYKIQVKNLHKAFGKKVVLDGVDIEIKKGESLVVIGGSGTDAASRLGLSNDAPYDGPRAAFAAVQRWRRRADHPLNDPFTARACRAAVRSAEALVADYAAQGR